MIEFEMKQHLPSARHRVPDHKGRILGGADERLTVGVGKAEVGDALAMARERMHHLGGVVLDDSHTTLLVTERQNLSVEAYCSRCDRLHK